MSASKLVGEADTNESGEVTFANEPFNYYNVAFAGDNDYLPSQ